MIDDLMKYYKNELNDVISYVSLADGTRNQLERCILIDIAKEEQEHATMLYHIMKKEHAFNETEELKELRQKSENALSRV